MRVAASVALLVATALAGCLGTSDAPGDADAAVDDAAQAATVIDVPTWQVGDWWVYDSNVGRITYVVTEDLGADLRVDVDHEVSAFFDARYDVSTIGPIRKADLAGKQGGDRVSYFSWPAEDGATWTTRWDAEQRTVTITGIEGDRVLFEAVGPAGLSASYSYDTVARWFGHMDFYGEDGSVQFELDLVDSGSDYLGQVLRYDLQQVADTGAVFGAVPSTWATTFQVADTVTDIYVEFNVACPSGSVTFGVGPTDESGTPNVEEGWGIQEQCPHDGNYAEVIQPVDGKPEWSSGFIGQSPAADGTYALQIMLRTLERIAVRSA